MLDLVNVKCVALLHVSVNAAAWCRARPAFIVGFWAIAAAAGSNTGYVSMRTIAQINDAMTEHNADLMSEVMLSVNLEFLS